MRDARCALRTIATDRRIWGVTTLLVGWPALGMLTRVGPILETATPIVYVYLIVLNAVVPGIPGDVVFWTGLVAFCFVVAVALVGLFDWVRTRPAVAERRERRTIE